MLDRLKVTSILRSFLCLIIDYGLLELLLVTVNSRIPFFYSR